MNDETLLQYAVEYGNDFFSEKGMHHGLYDWETILGIMEEKGFEEAFFLGRSAYEWSESSNDSSENKLDFSANDDWFAFDSYGRLMSVYDDEEYYSYYLLDYYRDEFIEWLTDSGYIEEDE